MGKKFILFLLVVYMSLIAGCADDNQKDTVQGEKTSTIADSIATVEAIPSVEEKNEISMEDIQTLSEQRILTVYDVKGWEGLEETSPGFYYYEFNYNNKKYRLDITESETGELLSVRLVDMETFISIDIRTGNVEHLIANTVSMEDYLTVTFPEELSVGAYDIFIGHYGGSRLENEKSQGTNQPCGAICILGSLKSVFSDGELINIGIYDNNIFHLEKESIKELAVPCILTLAEVEGESDAITEKYWIAYFAKEGCDICYGIALKESMYTKEEVINVLKTVQFTDRAFY